MLPYFQITEISLGPITIHVWGLMVALGILAGAWAASRLARARMLSCKVIWDLTLYVVIGAFLFARLFYVFVYEPEFYLKFPLQMLCVWDGGFSIAGGFVGAALFGLVYLRQRRVDVMAYADTAIFGFPLGLFIGRIGCFLIHDHPGTATNFFLGVLYPDGIVRHDHGLYLAINGLAMFLVFLIVLRFRSNISTASTFIPPTTHTTFITMFLLWYGFVRFFLDFLRTGDTTYAMLTPAQWLSLVMIVAAPVLWFVYRHTHLQRHSKVEGGGC